MSGETNLNILLASMRPKLNEDVFVFVTTSEPYDAEALKPCLRFEEEEGATLIVKRAVAETHGLDYEFPCRMITLSVHSSLEAVGFMAAIATHLAKVSMGVNPVSGFYHDHLFVPADRAEEALAELNRLAEDLRSRTSM